MALIPRWGSARPAPHDGVVPDDLNVAPALLGLPLARPSRRLAAMAIDLGLLAVLTHLGNLWWMLALGLGLRERARRDQAPVQMLAHTLAHTLDQVPAKVPAKLPRRAVWLLVLLLAVLGARSAWHQQFGPTAPDTVDTVDTANTAEEAQQTVREALDEARAEAQAEAVAGSVAEAPAPAASAADTAQVKRLRSRIKALEADLAAAQAGGLQLWQHRIGRWVKDYGLGYGWATLYFTLLPGWLGGTGTPGKRLLGLQVVELTGKPMTPMRWLKRYGGYAAGMATGGLGLAQLLWDSNRQALQDKTAHTVVVALRRAAGPPPAAASEPAPAPPAA